MIRKEFKVAAIAAALAITTGCASTSDLDALRTEVQQANQTAESAQAKADSASREAAEARSIAEEALSRSNETDSKIDQMFKKSMYK